MQYFIRIMFILGIVFTTSPAYSEVVLLIHGYLSNSAVWVHSGVIRTLESHGWKQVGVYSIHPNGQVLHRAVNSTAETEQHLMVVDLPSEAPILLQSDIIASVVKTITDTYPDEPVTLVGHSAGGLAARAALVRHDLSSVKRLISIASPHLGTDMAEKALDVSNITGPASMLPDMFGGGIARTTQRSQHLYSDLARPRPGNLLDWLNRQPHPDITWDSVIHTGVNGDSNDSFVAAYSQDMNQIQSLQGHSTVFTIQVEHSLNPADGLILKGLLSKTNL